MTDFDPFARNDVPGDLPPAPEPTEEQLAPDEGEWYQPYPERPRSKVLPEARWPRDLPKGHALRWPNRFYVETEKLTVGLVPWPGSHVVWPWEAGWQPDVSAVAGDAKPESSRKR